jgi:hypothetical protein
MLRYLLYAYLLPDQCARLVNCIYHPEDQIVVHVDRRVEESQFRHALDRYGLTNSANVQFVMEREPLIWAGFQIVNLTRNCIRDALKDPAWNHFIVLSAQDYPVMPLGAIREKLRRTPLHSYMFISTERDHWPEDRRHGNSQWYWDGRMWRFRWGFYMGQRWPLIVPGRFRFGVPMYRRIPSGLRASQGSAWWALQRDAARWIIDYGDRRPELDRFFERTFAPDESYFQMLFDASPYRDMRISDDLHFESWASWHPRVLTGADLGDMLASEKCFARKFDSRVDSTVLDELDDIVHSENAVGE